MSKNYLQVYLAVATRRNFCDEPYKFADVAKHRVLSLCSESTEKEYKVEVNLCVSDSLDGAIFIAFHIPTTFVRIIIYVKDIELFKKIQEYTFTYYFRKHFLHFCPLYHIFNFRH